MAYLTGRVRVGIYDGDRTPVVDGPAACRGSTRVRTWWLFAPQPRYVRARSVGHVGARACKSKANVYCAPTTSLYSIQYCARAIVALSVSESHHKEINYTPMHPSTQPAMHSYLPADGRPHRRSFLAAANLVRSEHLPCPPCQPRRTHTVL